MGIEEVMNFLMEKLKEALLILENFGGQVLLTILNFAGQLLLTILNFAGQLLLTILNFAGQLLLKLLNVFGQVLLTILNLGVQALVILRNLGAQALGTLENLGAQALATLKNFGTQALAILENFGGQALVTLKFFSGQVILVFDNFIGQVKNFCGEIVSWFNEVFPPETRVEKINYWFHLALPYLIMALILSLFIYCCYHDSELLPNVIDHLKTACVEVMKIMKIVFTCCWRSKGPVMKMMKAPGRNIIIPRSAFEINPRLYFFNLRTFPGDMLV